MHLVGSNIPNLNNRFHHVRNIRTFHNWINILCIDSTRPNKQGSHLHLQRRLLAWFYRFIVVASRAKDKFRKEQSNESQNDNIMMTIMEAEGARRNRGTETGEAASCFAAFEFSFVNAWISLHSRF